MEKLTHQFRSGNDADITVPETIQRGCFNEVLVEWHRYPPSPEDLREYAEDVYPRLVLPEIRRLAEQTFGLVEEAVLAPGVRGFTPIKRKG